VVITGRFAPSPTGPLHHGSLLAAVGSYLFARSMAGRWLVRIDDLDRPRVVAGAADEQLRALEAYGLWWDDDVVYQSQRTAAYQAALDRLSADGRTFRCGCSRADLAAHGGDGAYPGTCRGGLPPGKRPRSVRARVPDGPVCFTDRLQGPQRQALASLCGDFVVRRADGLFAYQLAVVVDDLAAGVTEVVRGVDLLESTGRQIHLYRALGAMPAVYAHLPLVVTAAGAKLSKGHGATPIPLVSPGREVTLHQVLTALGQVSDDIEPGAPVGEQLAAAVARFDAARVPRMAIQLDHRVLTRRRASKVITGDRL
jgi:glutamyl-Q tRNA(Asp) synthetase